MDFNGFKWENPGKNWENARIRARHPASERVNH
jgi:hypothetical protein